MSDYQPPVLRARRDQMYFELTDRELARLRPFGVVQVFAPGDYLVRTGDGGLGMTVILSGRIEIVRRDGLGLDAPVTTLPARHFIAEVAQLSGGPSVVDVRAKSEVTALLIPPSGLRSIVIAEAELGERIMRALILRRVGLIESGAAGPVLIGPSGGLGLMRLQTYLARNGIPHRVLDPRVDRDAEQFLASLQPPASDLPLVICPNGELLQDPSEQELARCLGLLPQIDPAKRYDVAVVGAGPAGLATAVYAASEGLAVLVVDAQSFGGQAGASSRIENYLGFPTGVSGQALSGRAFIQAQKFGADLMIPMGVERLATSAAGDGYALELTDGSRVRARTVVIASGAYYRRPAIEGLSEAEREGVHYWASPIEASLCAGQEVALVGGGNSAGQAAVYLAARASKVWMLVRRSGLEPTMSRYLIERIRAQPNIELVTHTEIERLQVDDAGALARLTWRDNRSGRRSERAIRHLFLFIGADPCTRWLGDCPIEVDDKGFVLTGRAATTSIDSPLSLSTSLDGVFAIGDVRSGSTKRVAAAVGEGAAVVAQIHRRLAQPLSGNPMKAVPA